MLSRVARAFASDVRRTLESAPNVPGHGLRPAALAALLYRELGSHWAAISVMLGGALVGPLLLALACPAPAGRALAGRALPEIALEAG